MQSGIIMASSCLFKQNIYQLGEANTNNIKDELTIDSALHQQRWWSSHSRFYNLCAKCEPAGFLMTGWYIERGGPWILITFCIREEREEV